MNKIKQQKMMCYFEENKINIKTLPTNELRFLNYIKEDLIAKKEDSFAEKYFRMNEFYDNEIAYKDFFECYKDFAMENVNNETYKDDEFVEVVAKGIYIGTSYAENSLWIVYYKGIYYAMDDEGDCSKYSKNLMMLPIEGFWKNRYDFYICCKDMDMTEEDFNKEEPDYELKDFILQDWKPYEKLLEYYNMKVDLSYYGLREKYK